MRFAKTASRFATLFLLAALAGSQAPSKPRITLDEFFDSVSIADVAMAPDGHAVVIETARPDWKSNLFRDELWLSTISAKADGALQASSPVLLTGSAKDHGPKWSPDSRWIAFLSERPNPGASEKAGGDGDEDPPAQLWIIAPNGGEALPLTAGEEGVHAFCWSADGKYIFYSTRIPWDQKQKDANKEEWNDVVRWRESERGDALYRLDVLAAIAQRTEAHPAQASVSTPFLTSPYYISQVVTARDGVHAAFLTDAVSRRLEDPSDTEIYTFDPRNASPQEPHQLTHNSGLEESLSYSSDGARIYAIMREGTPDAPYAEVNPRLYSFDSANGQSRREVADLGAAVLSFNPTADGGLFIDAQQGIERLQVTQSTFGAPLRTVNSWPGEYSRLSLADHGRTVFTHSSYEHPAEVYIAGDTAHLAEAVPISRWNQLFTQRDLPRMKPYHWRSSDGTALEGTLIYPPARFEQKNLRMLVLIHGGPAFADRNRFHADWYDWEIMAASQGWLVFRPNYRGSIGYGDKFLHDIVPHLVSVPGRDILEGVDALVKDGIADPARLAIGGHSYGGYLTNWLITQTTRFKAAVTAAGAVEHAANWGFDDLTYDDAWYLGGRPWESPKNYHDEAALFRMDQVTTPTHIVTGDRDIRVSHFESVALERALHSLHVPASLLVMPGETHNYEKNPWHGKIKVREELRWLEKYVSSEPGVE